MSISINVLGGLSIYYNGNKVTLPKSKRTRALLIYLLMTNKPHRRERLCEVFWDSPGDIKGALRWSLSKIRPLLNDENKDRIIADREIVVLKSDDIILDIHLLIEELKEQCISPERLKKILNQLDEPLLCGLDLYDQRLYQQWLVSERNEINNLYCDVLFRLSMHWELSPTEQLNWNRILLDRSPYNTQVARLLLSKLKMLNLISEYNVLSKELELKFQRLGIKWDESASLYKNENTKYTSDSLLHN